MDAKLVNYVLWKENQRTYHMLRELYNLNRVQYLRFKTKMCKEDSSFENLFSAVERKAQPQ